MRWLILLVLVLVAACRGEAKPKPKVVEDAGVADAAPRASTPAERDALFLGVPTAKAVKGVIERLAGKPHVAGTKANEEVAKEIMRTLGRMGWRIGTAPYGVYLPHPRKLAIKVAAAPPFELAVTEPAAARHGDAPELLGWNAASASGTVKAPVVYGSYGRAAELAVLAQAGIDVRGKVLLLRYGPLYRGAQLAAAEAAGAAAVIFYADPEDQPDRPRDSVQRGTVAYAWHHTGDPLTPGVAATPDAKRLAVKDARVLPKLPVLTITAHEAQKLIAAIGGPAATPELAGGLAGPYRLGPGPSVEVTVELDGETRQIRNIVAILDGASRDAVVLGNHYDAWGPGALDPHSGTAAMIEIARGLRALTLAGWRPRRTIVLAFWDAEEHSAIGSTEWVEEQREMLHDNAVAYFNLDTLRPGALVVNGSPALREHVRSCAGDAVDPATGNGFAPTFGDAGIGSDATAFLHHAGVASLEWRTAGPAPSVWHSVLDDLAHVRAVDPDFAFVPAIARAVGLCAIRLADAEYLPVRYSETATWLAGALDALARVPGAKLDRTKLDAALERLRMAATRAESGPVRAGGDPAKCNHALTVAERGFLAPDGLAGRPWYRHLAIGPNPADGGSMLVPELAAAVAAKDGKARARATERLAAAIDRVAAALAPCP